jgi:hypothetical protein
MMRDVDTASWWVETFVALMLGAVAKEHTWERLWFQFVVSIITKVGETFAPQDSKSGIIGMLVVEKKEWRIHAKV